MLESLKKTRTGKRWPRGQKFALSSIGVVAEEQYRDAVQAARAQGRTALDAAQQAWAEPLAVSPSDGVLLGELRTGRKSLADLAKGLESCGIPLPEVKVAIDRLCEAGLVAPSPGPGGAGDPTHTA